jgi:hypothetical protein
VDDLVVAWTIDGEHHPHDGRLVLRPADIEHAASRDAIVAAFLDVELRAGDVDHDAVGVAQHEVAHADTAIDADHHLSPTAGWHHAQRDDGSVIVRRRRRCRQQNGAHATRERALEAPARP